MTADPKDLFVTALRQADHLPAALRAAAGKVKCCQAGAFDDSYIAFLDEQIERAARGPEWTERLKRRRAGLAPFCGVPLVSGSVRVRASDFTVYVHPVSRRVVYCEEYADR